MKLNASEKYVFDLNLELKPSQAKLDFLTLDWPIKCQCYPHIETSQLICCENQLTGYYMRATLVVNGLIDQNMYIH